MRGMRMAEAGHGRVPLPLKTRIDKSFIGKSNISAYNIIDIHKY